MNQEYCVECFQNDILEIDKLGFLLFIKENLLVRVQGVRYFIWKNEYCQKKNVSFFSQVKLLLFLKKIKIKILDWVVMFRKESRGYLYFRRDLEDRFVW